MPDARNDTSDHGVILLTPPDGDSFKHKASSVLNSSAEFSSKHMFDCNVDTCWNSDQGSPQFIIFDFKKNVTISSIQIMFQGGFVGQDGTIEVGTTFNNLQNVQELQTIEDTNEEQSFVVEDGANDVRYMRLTFNSSTDFYGRVTIYSLKVYGQLS